MILLALLLTNWRKTRTIDVSDHRNYLNLFELLQRRTFLNKNNPKVVRALKICSPLIENDGKTADEGKGIEGSKLEFVAVLMRHGARGSLVDFVNRTEIDCSVNRTENPDYETFVNYVKNAEHRRSSRDRFRSYVSVVQTRKVCGLGQLSEYGALQQLRSGQLFRKAYDKFVQNERDVTIVSTNTERTYQSAIAFLYGLVPDFDFAQIVPKLGRGSTLCYSQEYCECPYVESLQKHSVNTKRWLLESHKAVIQLLNVFEHVLYYGTRHDVDDVQSDGVLDKLLVFVCHRDALPCINEKNCITVDQLNNVISFHEFRNKQMMTDGKLRVLARLTMQGLLVEILRRMEDVRKRHNKRREDSFVLYSAHDITVLPMIIALGFYDGVQLPFSARVVFELYSRPSTVEGGNESTRVFHLKILFNGKDVTKRVSFCNKQLVNNDAVQSEFCLLDTFAQFVNEDYLKELNVTSFSKACQLHNSKSKQI